MLDEDITKRIQIGHVNFTTPGYLMKFPEGPQMIFRAKVDEMHTMSVIAAVESSFVALSISNKKQQYLKDWDFFYKLLTAPSE